MHHGEGMCHIVSYRWRRLTGVSWHSMWIATVGHTILYTDVTSSGRVEILQTRGPILPGFTTWWTCRRTPKVMAPKRKQASGSASKDSADAQRSKRKKTEAPVKDTVQVSACHASCFLVSTVLA